MRVRLAMKRPSFKVFSKSFARAEAGLAAIEFALILPFMLMLYFGLVDLTGLIGFNRKITSVANTMADLVGQNRTSVLLSDISDYYNATALIMSPTPANQVTVNLFGYRMVSGVPTQRWKTTNGTGPGCNTVPPAATMANLMAAGNDLIVSVACYRFTPYVATFMGDKLLGSTTIKVEQLIMVRPRSTAKLVCYTTTAQTAICT
jgi:Flp pilus assembly protein TadG